MYCRNQTNNCCRTNICQIFKGSTDPIGPTGPTGPTCE